jgi:acyl transferase domain-containing protein
MVHSMWQNSYLSALQQHLLLGVVSLVLLSVFVRWQHRADGSALHSTGTLTQSHACTGVTQHLGARLAAQRQGTMQQTCPGALLVQLSALAVRHLFLVAWRSMA